MSITRMAALSIGYIGSIPAGNICIHSRSQWGRFSNRVLRLARMIHDGSSRNLGAALRDQRAEQMGTANKKGASLHQYMGVPKGEPTGRRLVAAANPQLQQKRS